MSLRLRNGGGGGHTHKISGFTTRTGVGEPQSLPSDLQRPPQGRGARPGPVPAPRAPRSPPTRLSGWRLTATSCCALLRVQFWLSR